MTQKRLFSEIAGWYGIAAILGAYMCVSLGIFDGTSMSYQLLNLTGAIGVIIVSIEKRVKQTLVLNLVWVVIAGVGLLRSIAL